MNFKSGFNNSGCDGMAANKRNVNVTMNRQNVIKFTFMHPFSLARTTTRLPSAVISLANTS